MSKETRTRGLWFVLGSVTLVGVWAVAEGRRASRDLKAEAERQGVVLRGLGATKGTVADPVSVTPSLKSQADEAKRAGVLPGIGVHTESRSTPFTVPCSVEPDPHPAPGAGEVGPAPPPPPLPVLVKVVNEGLVWLDDVGTPYWKGSSSATLTRGEWNQTQALTMDESKTMVAVSPEIAKAVKMYRSPIGWQAEVRLGVDFPSPGVTVGGSFYPRGRRIGFFADGHATYQDVTTYNSYLESYGSARVVDYNATAGVTFRIGPR